MQELGLAAHHRVVDLGRPWLVIERRDLRCGRSKKTWKSRAGLGRLLLLGFAKVSSRRNSCDRQADDEKGQRRLHDGWYLNSVVKPVKPEILIRMDAARVIAIRLNR